MTTPAWLFVTVLIPGAVVSQPSGMITARILEAVGARAGLTLCEIGAGDGALSIAAARLVGPTGRVYTSELGAHRVKALQDKVAGSDPAPITVVAGDPDRTNFPDVACDAVFMHNVYHHFAEPAAMNASIRAALKPGGRLAIVDFAPPGTEAARPADRGNDGMHGISQETLARELKDAGFDPVSSEDGAERWFMVVVVKPGR